MRFLVVMKGMMHIVELFNGMSLQIYRSLHFVHSSSHLINDIEIDWACLLPLNVG